MIQLKSLEEIAIMRRGGERLRKVASTLKSEIREGMMTEDIDKRAKDLLKSYQGEPSFTKVKGYKWATCLPINEQVVHTPPSKRKLKNGDVLTLDIGMYHGGFHTDYADTFIVGASTDPKVNKFLEVGKNCLSKATSEFKIGNYVGQISKVIDDSIHGSGYFILRELTGHGIGRKLHEDPFIPGYLDRPVRETPKIQSGLVVAIEIIYSMGTEKIVYEADGWSIKTADERLSACFEHTVTATKNGPLILT